MSTEHNFWRERRAEADSNRGPSAYQPNAKPLGHIVSPPWTLRSSDFIHNDVPSEPPPTLYCLPTPLLNAWSRVTSVVRVGVTVYPHKTTVRCPWGVADDRYLSDWISHAISISAGSEQEWIQSLFKRLQALRDLLHSGSSLHHTPPPSPPQSHLHPPTHTPPPSPPHIHTHPPPTIRPSLPLGVTNYCHL